MPLRPALFALFALLVGCSLIGTGDLSATSDAVGAVDASRTLSPDAATNDPTTASDAGDSVDPVGLARDADVDAPEESDAGYVTDAGFCASHPSHTFCADFDDGPYDKGWSYTYLQPRETLALDPSTFRSPPSSLLARLTDDGGTDIENAQLLESVPCTATHVHEEFDMVLQTTGMVESEQTITEINSITQDQSSTGFEIALVDDGAYVIGNTLTDAGTMSPTARYPLPFSLQGGWLHVTFDVIMGDATSGRISVGVTDRSGNTASFSQTVATASAGCAAMAVVIGPDSEPNGAGAPTQPMTINYDDVTIDVE